MQGLVDVVADTVTDLVSQGEDVPEPPSERSYSVPWSVENEEFVAPCAEFPSLS